ncbi:MAG: HAD-IA family hydrolase [Nocardioides sp.]
MRPDAVVFDVDGTLVESEQDGHRVAFNRAFEEAGLPDRWDRATYRRLLAVPGGRPRLTTWFVSRGRSAAEAETLAASLHARKSELMRELCAAGEVPARPGVAELLGELAGAGIDLHVATTGSPGWVLPLLARRFGPLFDVVVTGADVARLKPDPEAYLEVLRRTGRPADRVVAVEDSTAGVRAAVAAGLRCLAVRNDDTREDDVHAADLVVDEYADPRVRPWLSLLAAERALRPGAAAHQPLGRC